MTARAERERKPWSLRRRLLAAIVAASTVLWLASLGIVTMIAWIETNEVFDDALEESGQMLMAATTDWQQRGLLARAQEGRGPDRKVDMQYQIVVGGQVVQRTSGAPSQPFVRHFDDSHGFADPEVEQRRWRVFVVRDEERQFEVQVGQRYKKRYDILQELAEHLWLPVAGFLLLLALVCWLLTGRVLKPLRATVSKIAAKSPGDLAQVELAGQPRELLPIVQALNGVLGRLDVALQSERRFTADAAHELRTPLAGLHMHVQLLQRQHPELVAPFQKLRRDITRVTALVDSLLTLARLDPLARAQVATTPVALAPLLEQLLASHAQEATSRNMALSVRCELDIVEADPAMLDILLRNLLDNALRYCPDGSRIEIVAERHAGRPRIGVRDNGPGVDNASRQRLSERFFRVLGQQQAGSGLGLSIVKRIADLHGMTLAFGPGLDGRGLGVTLDFPGACAP
ncbi:ATP-binding protein [Janthinobacterium sp. PC23-8]|uniref:ATP-binding protein n=1 Tax=Janthinobacterium sp. PC23-8 TaxID=2012679 RepID=UPI000B975B2B|nr:ATP-binding protein [Janthinobacterium sp. PC23-8]OYO30337.1 two-component sensor histidine kinase [Janthinobacterium sp. PC23-8]